MDVGVPFTINQAPVSVSFICPYCDEEVSIPWEELDSAEVYEENEVVTCPECGERVALDELEDID